MYKFLDFVLQDIFKLLGFIILVLFIGVCVEWIIDQIIRIIKAFKSK
jgi:hypothetical protein